MNKKLSRTPLLHTLSLSLMLAIGTAQAQTPAEQELLRRVDQLAAELAKLRTELAQLQQQAPTQPSAPAASIAALVEPAPAAQARTVLGGYAELNYNRPNNNGKDAQADLRRLVLGVQHRFDEKTKIVTEIEVEHAVASAGDPGEVAIEQAYVEHQFHPNWALRGGLFLMPMGLLNENHEPTAYYGVERNFVETAIIPSTWREGGIQLVGQLDSGWTLQAGIATGFDLNKWDAASSEGRESPLGAIHQELALARSRDLALFGAANYRGIPGLLLGASVFSGQATHSQQAASSRITLWDLHARWTPGRWDLSALYSRGSISNTAALNMPLVGSDSLIPARFDGAYLQAAYKLWEQGSYVLKPFARWERFNTASRYAELGAGLTPEASDSERVVTLGANFEFAPGVVLKADLQRFRLNKDLNRVNLGLGWSF
ncbi:porin [Paucibacter sediminis]|uniref:Porin n=1 Tax=Paucibacter sediminis TaxID=3019553 RepID=A0AA95SN99_9BURK|nr:porin [Paucibacter sp. S2-9]WIT14138.1 porin [Paucibacter sp. S2-9]